MSTLEKEKEYIKAELLIINELIDKAIYENSRSIQNQEVYNKKFDSLIKRQDKAKNRLDEIETTIADKKRRYNEINKYFEMLNNMEDTITEFDDNCFVTMVDYVKVNSKDDIKVIFKDGRES